MLQPVEEEAPAPFIPSTATAKDIKKREMASTSFLSTYFTTQKKLQTSKPVFADLDVCGAPQDLADGEIKKIAGIKQLVSMEFEQNHIQGISTGKGRIQFRAKDETEMERVKMKLVEMGCMVQDHSGNPKVKT